MPVSIALPITHCDKIDVDVPRYFVEILAEIAIVDRQNVFLHVTSERVMRSLNIDDLSFANTGKRLPDQYETRLIGVFYR